jgi:hypothetical protein
MDPHHDSPIPTSNAHPQSQSPLFTTLPGELRNEIFRLALQQHVDTSRLYERETYWTRPGVEGPLAIDTALLRTCKRVWGETKDMLGKELMMRFYLGMRARAPEGECIEACLVAVYVGCGGREGGVTCGVSFDWRLTVSDGRESR